MITFVYGGSGSGKSEYAESIVIRCPSDKKRYYIATMMAYGEEGARRVERHRKLRAGKGFETIECPTNILESIASMEHPEKSVVLLECIPNLVANEMFDSSLGEEGIVERISSDLEKLCKQVGEIVIVSDNVFEDGTDYHPDTIRYMEYLSRVNQRAAKAADRVVEVVAGIHLEIKSPLA